MTAIIKRQFLYRKNSIHELKYKIWIHHKMGHTSPIIKVLSTRANSNPEKEECRLHQNGKAKSRSSVLIILALIGVLILLRNLLLRLKADDLWDVLDSRL